MPSYWSASHAAAGSLKKLKENQKKLDELNATADPAFEKLKNQYRNSFDYWINATAHVANPKPPFTVK